jgi:uncharacterized protein YbgA (DUF1722 family)/uncharacterized protein YbbK (DUF523 family)
MTVPRESEAYIPVGVGSCLLGAPVRFNGLSKKHNPVLADLSQFFSWRSFCPEMAIGLGVPRAPIRLVGGLPVDGPAGVWSDLRAVDSVTGVIDVTQSLRDYGAAVLKQQPDLCGYILVKGSPSCGLERVKRYNAAGVVEGRDATGIFAAALSACDPLLPLEEDGRLQDQHLRESFVARVFTYHAWRELQREGLSCATLQTFYAQRKYLIMSRHIATYKQLGKLLATADKGSLAAVAQQTITLIMSALSRPATRSGHTNTLMHIRGYLKNQLSANEKAELSDLIEQYRQGFVPLVVPLTLLRHHFSRHPHSYIERQLFMQPYPSVLRLRNHL